MEQLFIERMSALHDNYNFVNASCKNIVTIFWTNAVMFAAILAVLS